MVKIIIVCCLAGIGAGLGTGFAGLSATVFISPLLVAFLDVPAYEAIGIGLLSDVLASGVSAFTYYRHKNIDIKNSWLLLVTVLLFTVAGSVIAYFVPNESLGLLSIIGALFMGVQFVIKSRSKKQTLPKKDVSHRAIKTVAGGVCVGFICGFMGTGGGLMMLMLLTLVLGYDLAMAVGTSTFIMAFTALLGAGVHIGINGMPEWYLIVICVLSTAITAWFAAFLANRIKQSKVKLFTGILLIAVGVLTLCYQLFV